MNLSKAGVLRADEDLINENLFIGTMYDTNNFGSPASDYSRPLAIYNGSVGLHTFENGEDTILLSSAGNIGICFVRLATDIALDSSSNYTISCWSKCSKSGAHLDIGLSYYNTSDTGVWRGGSGAQNYNAVDTWQYFTRTFKPDTDTKAICYCFTVVGTSGGTDTFTIKQCKLEKGSVATAWVPNSSEFSNTQGFIEGSDVFRVFDGHYEAREFIEI